MMILEAMKMLNRIIAPLDGTVKVIRVAPVKRWLKDKC